MTQNRLYSISILLTITAVICFITSCTRQSINYASLNNGATLSTDDYLLLASNAPQQTSQHYLLLAAYRAVQDRQFNQAKTILENINGHQLTQAMRTQKQLIQAQIALFGNHPEQTLAILAQINIQSAHLPPSQMIKYHELNAKAFAKTGNLLASLNEQSQLLQYTSPTEKQNTLINIWKYLQRQNDDSLTRFFHDATTTDTRGWISLALLAHKDMNTNQYLQRIQAWQQQYPNHPAQTLTGNINDKQTLKYKKVSHIAILLPLSGPLKQQGEAVRNGILSAYYENKHKSDAPNIKVYDTYQEDITTTYNNAIKQGAQFIIGPLTKTNLTQLINADNIRIPTLALNALTDNSKKINNLYQFGLTPEDAAVQLATKTWNEDHHRIIIIAPKNTWAARTVNAFKKQWVDFGGKLTAELLYSNKDNLTVNIRWLLNITPSQKRARSLRWLLKEKLRFIPRRRQDFDAIFLIATPVLGKQIMPLLRFYYAGNIPVYTTSLIYQSNYNARTNRDLNGIIFNDMPWLVEPKQSLPANLFSVRQQIQTLWRKSFMQNARLYALGIDAYNIAPKLIYLTLLPHMEMPGATGMLTILPNQHIYRTLVFAQIEDGQVKSLP